MTSFAITAQAAQSSRIARTRQRWWWWRQRRRSNRYADTSYARCLSLALVFLCALQWQAARAQLLLPPPRLAFARPQAMAPPLAPPPPPNVITVAGSEPLMRREYRVDQVIMPYENFTIESTDFLTTNSYVIDHKRFVEPFATRCMASTVLEEPDQFEPAFIIIRPNSERRLNATSPAELIQASGFEPSKRTTIFVHGFTQSYPSTDWLRRVRALFELNAHVAEQNLIIMDWGTASHGSYAQVAARVSAMGSFLANFLMKLIDDLGADRFSFHLIGHSLGAHVAGFAGKRMRPRKLGRITALDPAGPCFGKFFSNSPTDRLAPDDAYEVDVYHYDDNFLGLPGQIGQWDIYVNGGSSQPGATDNVNAMLQALVTMMTRRNRVLSESHTRSTEVPSCQLSQSACQQVAYECRDWPAFLAGECGSCDEQNSHCFFMGFPFQYDNMRPLPLRQQYPPKRLFIATSQREAFCLQHYQIVVKFEQSQAMHQMAKRLRWRLQLELTNEHGERANVSLSNQPAPNVFTYLLLSERRPTRFTSALLQVRSSSDNSIVPLRQLQQASGATKPHSGSATQPPIKVLHVDTNFMSDINPQGRRALSSHLCPIGWVSSFAAAHQNNGRQAAEAANHISIDPNDEWLGLEECDRHQASLEHT